MSFCFSYIRTGKGYVESNHASSQRRRKQEHTMLSTQLIESFQIKLILLIIHIITSIQIQQIQKPSTSPGSSKDNWNLRMSTLATRHYRDSSSEGAQRRPSLPCGYEAAAEPHVVRKSITRHRKNFNATTALAKGFCMPLAALTKGFYKMLVNTDAGINKIMPKATSCIDE